MPIFSKYENNNIRNKDIFYLWLTLGSLDKVAKHLESNGIVNQKNNKPYSGVTLSRYAWRYALENQEEAYQMTVDCGNNLSPEYWEQISVRKAYSLYVSLIHNRKLFYEWLEKNNLEKYKDYRTQADFFRETGDLQTFQE